MKKPKRTSKRFYVGFVDGEIPTWTRDWSEKGARSVDIYTNKKVARKHYEDVRLVEIREIRKPRKSGASS